MEINRIKVVLKAFLIFTLASFFSSCEYLEIVNCSNCYSDPPSETLIYVKINENYTNFENAEINIYDGDYDDNILHYSFNAKRSSDTPIQLPIDKKYTFTATYYIDGKTYTVFDIATPTIEYSKDGCESPCYYIKGDQVNLKLNYNK